MTSRGWISGPFLHNLFSPPFDACPPFSLTTYLIISGLGSSAADARVHAPTKSFSSSVKSSGKHLLHSWLRNDRRRDAASVWIPARSKGEPSSFCPSECHVWMSESVSGGARRPVPGCSFTEITSARARRSSFTRYRRERVHMIMCSSHSPLIFSPPSLV